MSAQDIRNKIIRENIPILLKTLTGFDVQDENLQRCKQFTVSILRSHRSISTNSHEVRRKINAMEEKFIVDNFAKEADLLKKLCDEIIKHPACTQHYELDVQWSIIDLLISLAYNPTGALRKRAVKTNYNVELNDDDETERSNLEQWKDLLKEDFLPLHDYSLSDSDLSNWSDDDDVALKQIIGVNEGKLMLEHSTVYENLGAIKPPVKDMPYTIFNANKCALEFPKTVQSAWWQFAASDGRNESEILASTFALWFSNYLNENSNSFTRFENPRIVSEDKLVRELLWIFHAPVNCKFFELKNVVQLRDNVTIASVTQHGLFSFLESTFLPVIRMMHNLKKFIDCVYQSDDIRLPTTLECYAANLKSLLNPIWEKILSYEAELNTEPSKQINTIINLQAELRTSFAMLKTIYEIHQYVALDLHKYPAHILSMFLLTNLLDFSQTTICSTKANISLALFLTTIKVFCIIMDIWWTEGRLDDWQLEFIVERVTGNCDHNVRIRNYKKSKENSFHLADNISDSIYQSPLFRLLLEHSQEAGFTLNLLYEINRIGDLKNACAAIKGKLYDVFLTEVLAYIDNLNGTETKLNIDIHEQCLSNSEMHNDSVSNSQISTQDEFLLLAFSENNKSDKQLERCQVDYAADALSLVKRFEETYQLLPTEEVVLIPLKNILKTRIAFADSFVIRLFMDEFCLITQIQNIRRVLLLEATDVMHQFYSNIFKKIEARDTWANPFLLTTQLDDLLCTKYPDMTAMFCIKLKSSISHLTDKVCQAVDELIVSYNVSRELEHVITHQHLLGYNKVFRFLLKVKWAIITLENMQFLRSRKRRMPYEPFEVSELLMRRLEQLRFWILYDIQIIHFHLMAHVLQAMGTQLDARLLKCKNLQELKTVHRTYVDTICQHCCLADDLSTIKLGIEQLINLIYVLRLEWKSCIDYIENYGPLAVASDDESNTDGDDDDFARNNYLCNTQVNAIELTFVRCHQYLANNLNKEVYLNRKTFLSGLSAAFNASLPY